eukprot:1182724-Prymnesium_polylepis.1
MASGAAGMATKQGDDTVAGLLAHDTVADHAPASDTVPTASTAAPAASDSAPQEKLHRLFVYGTLMTGYGNNRVIASRDKCEISRCLGRALTMEKYTMTASGIPFVDPDTPTCRIHGEVWEVNDAVLPRVDRLEGHPNWYFRHPIQ